MIFPVDANKDCVLAWEAMPDALQGELTARQAKWLDEHLLQCEACRGQFADQQRLQRALSRPTDLPIDMEAGLQRLLERIDGGDVVSRDESPRRLRFAMPALAAAVLLQAIGLGVLGAKVWELESTPAYATLSQPAAPAPDGAIRLVPESSVPLADWNRVLDAHGLRVVGGPNAVGAYLVVPRNARADDPALLGRLRATPGILLAEPVAATP